MVRFVHEDICHTLIPLVINHDATTPEELSHFSADALELKRLETRCSIISNVLWKVVLAKGGSKKCFIEKNWIHEICFVTVGSKTTTPFLVLNLDTTPSETQPHRLYGTDNLLINFKNTGKHLTHVRGYKFYIAVVEHPQYFRIGTQMVEANSVPFIQALGQEDSMPGKQINIFLASFLFTNKNRTKTALWLTQVIDSTVGFPKPSSLPIPSLQKLKNLVDT